MLEPLEGLATDAAGQRKRRKKAAKAGLCKRCTHNKPKAGKKHCEACLKSVAQFNRERLAKKS